MLSPTAHADTDTHKHTFMYIERGPAITASQEKEEWGGEITMALFEEYNEYSSV